MTTSLCCRDVGRTILKLHSSLYYYTGGGGKLRHRLDLSFFGLFSSFLFLVFRDILLLYIVVVILIKFKPFT